MVDRKTLSPKVRFEVFKRDKFTCQYCGRAAPEVVLHADHVMPVASGGTNDVLNLITSCSTCNGGKGAVPLPDSSAVVRQHTMLADLEERRQQIEMMVKWRDELQEQTRSSVDLIDARIRERGGFEPSERGRSDIKNWIKSFGFDLVLRAVDESFDTYAEYEGSAVTSDSWDKAFSKIPGIIKIWQQADAKPYIRRILYIQGIVRARIGKPNFKCFDYLEHVHLTGEGLDELERKCKQIRSFRNLRSYYDDWLAEMGRPF